MHMTKNAYEANRAYLYDFNVKIYFGENENGIWNINFSIKFHIMP